MEIEIKTADGTMRAWHEAPAKASDVGIILYQDVFGYRPALKEMAARLASFGYHALVPDVYYRVGKAYGPYHATDTKNDPDAMAEARSMRPHATIPNTIKDFPYIIETMAGLGVTRLGTTGYCQGGSRSLRLAAEFPDVVLAAASLHGGNLAGDEPDVPIHHLEKVTGRLYVGTAEVDKGFPPEQAAKLAGALREHRIDHQIENYVGCSHGWCVPDNAIYNEAGAERHWTRLETLFGETFG